MNQHFIYPNSEKLSTNGHPFGTPWAAHGLPIVGSGGVLPAQTWAVARSIPIDSSRAQITSPRNVPRLIWYLNRILNIQDRHRQQYSLWYPHGIIPLILPVSLFFTNKYACLPTFGIFPTSKVLVNSYCPGSMGHWTELFVSRNSWQISTLFWSSLIRPSFTVTSIYAPSSTRSTACATKSILTGLPLTLLVIDKYGRGSRRGRGLTYGIYGQGWMSILPNWTLSSGKPQSSYFQQWLEWGGMIGSWNAMVKASREKNRIERYIVELD